MLRTIAYAADESMLLTFEEKRLYAFDSTTGAPLWQLELPSALLGVVFALPNAFGPGPEATPWRSGMSGSTAIAVDGKGALHMVDAATGRLVHSTEPYGEPTALASAADAFALGTAERVYVWRDGAKSEVPIPALALAFANDGTLAIASKKGTITIGSEPARQFETTVYALGWSARTGWLAGTDRGLIAVERQKTLLGGRVRGIAIEQESGRVAIPRGDQTVMVYTWPIGATAQTQITVKRRVVQDLAFGPKARLGLGVNRGDAAIIDVVDQSGKVVDRHPGREPGAWGVTVGIDPAVLTPAPKSPSFAKLGFGGVSTLAIGARLLFALMRSSHPTTYTPQPPDLSKVLACDITCESGRLADLRKSCAAQTGFACSSEANTAEQSFLVSDCDGARHAIAEIENKMRQHTDNAPIGDVYTSVLLAKHGLELSCKDTPDDGLITFEGPALHPTRVNLQQMAGALDWATGMPSDVVTAGDKAWITGVAPTSKDCALWSFGPFWSSSHLGGECTSAHLFARGSSAFTAAGTTVMRHADNDAEDLHWKGDALRRITGSPEPDGEIWVTTEKNELAHWHKGKWLTEPVAPGANRLEGQTHLTLGAIAVVDDTLLLGATDLAGSHFLYRRVKGVWSSTQTMFDVDPIYVAPDKTVYAGRGPEIAVSHDKGATWPTTGEIPFHVAAIWARSPKEVYVGGPNGLIRWDGDDAQDTGFSLPIVALSGTPTKLYAVVSHRP